MAIKDITKDKTLERGLDFAQTSAQYYTGRVIDFTNDADLASVFTHPIFDLAIGEAYDTLYIFVKEACTSGGAATIRFRIGTGGDFLTGLIPVGNLGLGHRYKFGGTAIGGTDGIEDGFAATTAQTIQMAVGTAAMTAGKLYVVLGKLRNLDRIIK